MKNKNALRVLLLFISLMPPAFAGTEWTSIGEKIDSIKGTYRNDVAKANAKKTQEIYLELDKIRGQDKNKFLTDLPQQPARIQWFLCHYLSSRKVIEAVPVLIKIYDGSNERADMSLSPDLIVSTVAELDGSNNRKFFLRVLPSINVWVRRSAVQALGQLPNDRETLLALRSALRSDRDPIVRREAAIALGNFPQDQWAKQGLEEALGDEQGVLQAIKLSLQKLNLPAK